jgi:hypothetical protein
MKISYRAPSVSRADLATYCPLRRLGISLLDDLRESLPDVFGYSPDEVLVSLFCLFCGLHWVTSQAVDRGAA